MSFNGILQQMAKRVDTIQDPAHAGAVGRIKKVSLSNQRKTMLVSKELSEKVLELKMEFFKLLRIPQIVEWLNKKIS